MWTQDKKHLWFYIGHNYVEGTRLEIVQEFHYMLLEIAADLYSTNPIVKFTIYY